MQSSDLYNESKRPARIDVFSGYQQWTRDTLEAAIRTGAILSDGSQAVLFSASQYEFPGDLTNSRSLRLGS